MASPTVTPWGTGTAGWYYFFDQVIAAEGRKYNGVVSGLEVTQSGSPSLTLNVASGVFHQGSPTVTNESYAGGTVTISAADATYPRVDYVSIYWNGSSAIPVVTTGVPDNSCPLPAVPIPTLRGAGMYNVVLAIVIVYPGATQILDEHIYDRRFFISGTVSITGAPNVGQLAQFSGNTEITNGNLTGDVTTDNSTATTIPVNTVTLGKMQAIAQNRMLGRVASGVGDIEELTAAQILTLLGLPDIRTVKLASDASVIASLTGTEVTEMRFSALQAGSSYLGIYSLIYGSTVTGTGIRYGLNFTGIGTPLFLSLGAGAAGVHDQDAPSPVNLSGMAGRTSVTTTLPIASVSVDTAGALMQLVLFAWITVDTSGDLQLWHACEVATGTISTAGRSGAVLIKLG